MYLYAAFTTDAVGARFWCTHTNRRTILRYARQAHALVGRVPFDSFRGGEQYGIDAPTFRTLMTIIGDYRPESNRPD